MTTQTLHIRYFAILREQSGMESETLETDAGTPAALYAALAARHPFTLPASRVRAAVNDKFADINAPLHNGDRVVFIPPVAGG